jgi:hypothetical protein
MPVKGERRAEFHAVHDCKTSITFHKNIDN